MNAVICRATYIGAVALLAMAGCSKTDDGAERNDANAPQSMEAPATMPPASDTMPPPADQMPPETGSENMAPPPDQPTEQTTPPNQ